MMAVKRIGGWGEWFLTVVPLSAAIVPSLYHSHSHEIGNPEGCLLTQPLEGKNRER